MDLNWKEELGEELLSEFLNTTLRYREQVFIYRGANLFNSLPLTIREEKKTMVFKASVKKWVKENIRIRPNR